MTCSKEHTLGSCLVHPEICLRLSFLGTSSSSSSHPVQIEGLGPPGNEDRRALRSFCFRVRLREPDGEREEVSDRSVLALDAERSRELREVDLLECRERLRSLATDADRSRTTEVRLTRVFSKAATRSSSIRTDGDRRRAPRGGSADGSANGPASGFVLTSAWADGAATCTTSTGRSPNGT